MIRKKALKQGPNEGAEAEASEVLYPFGFPLTLVKRIVNMDEEVRSISSDALKATAKASEIIVQKLAAKALKVVSAPLGTDVKE